MALKLHTQIKTWSGLSTDDRPLDAPSGSTFYETDTHKEYIWNGENWVYRQTLTVESFDETVQLLSDIKAHLEAIRFHFEQVTNINA